MISKIKCSLGYLLVISFFAYASPCKAQSLENIFVKMRERFKSLQDYQCLFASYTANRKKEVEIHYKYYFKKPKMIRMEALTGKYKGSILIYNRSAAADKHALDPSA